MDWKIELVFVPVTDVDRAKEFYVDKLGSTPTTTAPCTKGVDADGVDEQEWGRFVTLTDPDGNRWTLQQLPDYSAD